MTRIPFIIGHRGASREAPENTLSAFQLAWEQGADGIELDLRLTLDGHIVCLHDETARRTAGHAIGVAGAALAELRELDVGRWKGARWHRERIPTLAEVLSLSPPEKHLFLEIKSGPEILPALMQALAAHPAALERISFLAFSPLLIALLKRQLPQITACWLTDYRRCRVTGNVRPEQDEILSLLADIGADGLASKAHACLDAGFVTALRDGGFAVHVWTVDSAAVAHRYVELGVDSIMTNRPGWLRAWLARHHAT
ncbi:MAG: glycerophosphoryl diester phosphodiesterase [Proteobacteria bacterium]|nr:glycerophosphoryl diester phosphodiesterase [Pseudomonadota bacterium]